MEATQKVLLFTAKKANGGLPTIFPNNNSPNSKIIIKYH